MQKTNNQENDMLWKFQGREGKVAPEFEAFIRTQIKGMTPEAEKDIAPMTVRMPKTIVNMVKIKATLLDTSVQDILVELVKKWLVEG